MDGAGASSASTMGLRRGWLGDTVSPAAGGVEPLSWRSCNNWIFMAQSAFRYPGWAVYRIRYKCGARLPPGPYAVAAAYDP